MKIKLLLSLMIALFVISCENEEQVVDQQELTLEMKIENTINPTRGGDDNPNCSRYEARVNPGFPPVASWNITYHPSLSQDEIDCIRMEYFEMFPCLFLKETILTVPCSCDEVWDLFPCQPDGTNDVGTTIDEDPLVGGG